MTSNTSAVAGQDRILYNGDLLTEERIFSSVYYYAFERSGRIVKRRVFLFDKALTYYGLVCLFLQITLQL